MAKAYICEKCGKVFDKHDRYNPPDSESKYAHCLPLIVKTSDDPYAKKKYRDWYTKYFCAECGYEIEQFMEGNK